MPRRASVERVVVLMFENRSFDHLLGHLDHGGLTPVGARDRNIKDVSDPEGEWCSAHLLPTDADVAVDPGHGFDDVVRQLTGDEPPLSYDNITNGGFAWNYARRLVDQGRDPADACAVMGFHGAQTVPALSTLAQEFAVCSRWFSSVPSETWPNRLFAHGAQSEGLLENDVRLYGHRTTFDALTDAGVSWAVYAGDIPQAAAYVELNDAFKDRFNTFGEFLEDVEKGTLPRYSFIEPRHFRKVDSQHPTHSVARGDDLLRTVYTALTSDPEIWESVLFLVTYDEHGGFFDREKPPRCVAPDTAHGQQHDFAFNVLGVRVPAVVVSPFIRPGAVDDQTYDHASIVRTVFDALGVDERLTARDAEAASVLSLLTGSEVREPPSLPGPVGSAAEAIAAPTPPTVVVDDLQESLIQLAQLLDQHRGHAETVSVVEQVREGEVISGAAVDSLVAGFRQRHMGQRVSRIASDV